jgi:hypothetical protein
VSKNISKTFLSALLAAVMAIFICSCNEPASAPPPPVAQAPATPPPPPVQIQAPAAVPTAPPATPLVPVGDAPATEESEPTPRKGDSIDTPLKGPATPGDELVGNYSCDIDSKKLSIGPFKTPPFWCKIFKAGDGSLKLASTSEGAGSMKGDIKDSTAEGFFVIGKYLMAGNSLAIKVKMKLKGPGKYSGKGRGRFNDDKTNAIDYILTMTKK